MVEAVKPKGIPTVLRVDEKSYHWEKAVDQTRQTHLGYHNLIAFSADRQGNNFGVGDTVVHNPSWYMSRRAKSAPVIEGTAAEIHQYYEFDPSGEWIISHPDRTFGVRVVEATKGFLTDTFFLPSSRLEALTNDHVKFEGPSIPELRDVPFINPDQISEDLKAILAEPISRALWISYRRSHLLHTGNHELLNRSSVQIAQVMREQPVPRDRLALWFKKNLRNLGLDVSEEFAVFMVPYLVGEKEATIISA